MDDELKKMQEVAKQALERRKHERFKTEMMVRYRPISPGDEALLKKDGAFVAAAGRPARLPETRDLMKVIGEDISAGGMRINTKGLLAKGQAMLMEISIPAMPLMVHAIARVVWSNTVPGGYAAGLVFSEVNEPDLAKLENFIVLKKKLPPLRA